MRKIESQMIAAIKSNKDFINEKLGTTFEDFAVKEIELESDAYEKQ
jgi:hypothetical protein